MADRVKFEQWRCSVWTSLDGKGRFAIVQNKDQTYTLWDREEIVCRTWSVKEARGIANKLFRVEKASKPQPVGGSPG